MRHSIIKADAIDFLKAQEPGSLDLVFGSPPYASARLYLEDGEDLGIARNTDEWVAWMVEVFQAAQQACKGLVAFVVAGQTNGYRWSAGPALLMAQLRDRGFNLRNPPIYYRAGIPGSGGPDWLRSDYEWVVCTSKPGQLPWSDNTVCGRKPTRDIGGEVSYRALDGTRVNEKKAAMRHTTQSGAANNGGSGDARSVKRRIVFQEKVNPGNVIKCTVGGGIMGSTLCHENEAPFPEPLAEFFILSFCPPDGWVCDPFSGSGTTAAMAKKHGRNFTGCDLRQSQVDLGLKRLAGETPMMFV